MKRVRLASTAKRDLDAIFDYWAERASAEVAAELIYAVTDRFKLLAASPNIGRLSQDAGEGVRVFPAGKFLIYYRASSGTLHILHVVHGARDQSKALRTE